jgi:signal transduction histidine kinase
MSHADRATVTCLDAPQRLLEASERDVQRILLDIHDGPVQCMYAALSQLDLLRRALDVCGGCGTQLEARARSERVRRLLEVGLQEIRAFIGAQRAPEFATGDLPTLLSASALQHEALTDTEVTFRVEGAIADVSVPARIALFRVVQEALSNAYRHGGASRVELRLAMLPLRAPPRLQLTLTDNGAGFDATAPIAPGHFGIAGMRDRLQLVGGTVSIASHPGRGATVTVVLPVE